MANKLIIYLNSIFVEINATWAKSKLKIFEYNIIMVLASINLDVTRLKGLVKGVDWPKVRLGKRVLVYE